MSQKVDRRNYIKYAGTGVVAIAAAVVGYTVYDTVKPATVSNFTPTQTFITSTPSSTTPANTLTTSTPSTIATPTPTQVETTTKTTQSPLTQPDIIEIPYSATSIAEFENDKLVLPSPLYNENIWRDRPRIQYILIETYSGGSPNAIPPLLYYRHDDTWLELFLDVPSDTQYKQEKNYIFVFDLKSQYAYIPGARDVFQFEAYFRSENRLVFGEVACLDGSCKRPMGGWFNKNDYRYQWSFGPTPNSSEDHVMINILLAKDTLTKYSNTLLLSSTINDSFHKFGLAPDKEKSFTKIQFSNNK